MAPMWLLLASVPFWLNYEFQLNQMWTKELGCHTCKFRSFSNQHCNISWIHAEERPKMVLWIWCVLHEFWRPVWYHIFIPLYVSLYNSKFHWLRYSFLPLTWKATTVSLLVWTRYSCCKILKVHFWLECYMIRYSEN